MIKIPVVKPKFDKREWENLKECIESTWISSAGHFINEFEESFAAFCGTKYAISVCNGTAALHLSLLGLGIGAGDEVIVPVLTFVATANCVAYTGARPVFADIEPASWTIDPEKVEKLINKKTRAIIAVHLYGIPADMVRLKEIADKHGLFLIEDAAEAHGAEIKDQRSKIKDQKHPFDKLRTGRLRIKNNDIIWQKVGGLGDIGCFSFYGNKIITTGEGGMITLNSEALLKRINIFKNHGEAKGRKYYHPVIGFNYRMTNLQAAVGVAQLGKIDKFLSKRRQIDQLYRQHLKDIPGITFPPESTDTRRSVCWMFSILVDDNFKVTRDRLIKYLNEYGIETRPFFVPMHKLPMYVTEKHFPVADRISGAGLNLPTYVDLSENEIIFIAKTIKKAKGLSSS